MTTQLVLAEGLSPGNDEARRWAEDELSEAAYQPPEPSWLARVFAEIASWFGGFGFDGSPILRIVLIVAILAVVGGAVFLIARHVRRTPRRAETTSTSAKADNVLGGQARTSAEFREHAERALAAGDHDGCVVAAIRAIAKGAIERALLDDAPSLTAHEVSVRLGAVFGERRDDLNRATDLFDEIVYGAGHATGGQAREVLSLQQDLADREPSAATTQAAGFAVPR